MVGNVEDSTGGDYRWSTIRATEDSGFTAEPQAAGSSQWDEVTADPSYRSPHCKRIGGSVDTMAFLECRRDLLLCKLKCCCH